MREQSTHQPDEIVAWTLHDGPGRPPAGPPARWSLYLAGAWLGWTVLAIAGCEVAHESGAAHLDLPAYQDVLAVLSLLAIPVTIAFLAARRALGAWLSAVVGASCTWLSLTQIATVPAYTIVEASGFALLAVAGVWLAVRHQPHWQPSRDLSEPAIASSADLDRPADVLSR